MSRSRKKTPKGGIASGSDAWDKQQANQALRKAVHQALNEDTEVLPELREKSNIWSFKKDGKKYFAGSHARNRFAAYGPEAFAEMVAKNLRK